METFFTKDKNFYKVFFRLMLVVALQNLVAYSVNMLDNMMLGSYDQNALSGAATVNQIFFVVNQLALAIGGALIIMSSQYWGKKDTYAEDDELAMGILEALQGGGIDDATKEAFLGNKPYITGCGGLDELYAVMRGESFQDIAEQCGGIVSVTYSPAMIQTAIQDMVDHLDGEEVEQDHVIACEIVNSDNVKDYPSF